MHKYSTGNHIIPRYRLPNLCPIYAINYVAIFTTKRIGIKMKEPGQKARLDNCTTYDQRRLKTMLLNQHR